MLPSSARTNRVNSTCAYAVFFCQKVLSLRALSDFPNKAIIEFREIVTNPSQRAAAPHFVRHVLGLCADFYMVGIDASAIIARVAANMPIREIFSKNLHGDMMGYPHFPRHPNLTISAARLACLPLPASASTRNIWMKRPVTVNFSEEPSFHRRGNVIMRFINHFLAFIKRLGRWPRAWEVRLAIAVYSKNNPASLSFCAINGLTPDSQTVDDMVSEMRAP